MSKAYNIATSFLAYQDTFTDYPNQLNIGTANVTTLNADDSITANDVNIDNIYFKTGGGSLIGNSSDGSVIASSLKDPATTSPSNSTAGTLYIRNESTSADSYSLIMFNGIDDGNYQRHGSAIGMKKEGNWSYNSGYYPGSFSIWTRNTGDEQIGLTVSKEGYVLKPKQPAFHVTGLLANLFADTGAGTITNWKTVNLNRGNHWNNSTGTFTAPIDGTYIMHFDPMYKHLGGDITFRILKNGSAVIYNNPHTLDNGGYNPPWHNAPITWVGELIANDTISFYWTSSSNSSTYIYAAGLYTRCWGYLLS